MAFIKSTDKDYNSRAFRTFIEAKDVFEDFTLDENDRLEALNYILNHQEISYVLDMMVENYSDLDDKDHALIDHAFANFHTKPKRDDDFESILTMLKADNAYLRNKAITFLRDYGDSAKSFIKKLLDNDDRDIKIFAVNILGDVEYEDSRNILINFIKKEEDVNVIMTAVDYLGEIGEVEDIEILEELKIRFMSETYVHFGVDLAIQKIKA